jgi:hypothetical protein
MNIDIGFEGIGLPGIQIRKINPIYNIPDFSEKTFIF